MHPGNNLTRDEARRRAQLIQTPLYDISLDLTRDTDTFACEATIHFLCQEPGADSFIDFLVPSVDSCELNGEEVRKDAFNGARITLSNLRDANELHALATCDYQNIGVRDRHGDVVLGIFCRQSLAQYLDPEEIFTVTKQGLDFYAEAYKYPYPFQKYDQLFVPEFSAGAMENIGCVTFNESMLFRSKVTEAVREDRANAILHEMAHMWFGDLVTMRWWDDLWLNESFATFMSVLAQVEATRFKNGWVTFANQYKAGARRQDQLPTTHPVAADIPDIESVYLNFDAITYNKGACVLRQLVAYVSQDTFLRGVQRYIKQRQYSNADLAEFLQALEAGSGRDLTAWAKEWLQTAGVNTLGAEMGDGAVSIVQEA